jgi:hypothetical protein
MKDILHYSMLEQFPMFHAQSVHDSGVGGGWGDINAFTIGDINRLVLNEISGASLTCVDEGDATLVLTTPGDGKTSAPINNPANGTHLDLCYITLPIGTYVVDRFAGNHAASAAELQWYNRSDAVSVVSADGHFDNVNSSYRPFVAKFTVTGGAKQFYFRKLWNSAFTELATNWGQGYPYNVGGVQVADDIKIYKIG